MRENKETALKQPVILSEKEDVIAYLSHSKGDMSPSHWHEALEIIYLARGNLTVWLKDGEYKLSENQFIIINSRWVHSTYSLYGNDALLLQIPDAFLEKYVSQGDNILYLVPYQTKEKWKQTRINAITQILEQMYLILDTPREGGRLKFQSCLFELLYLLYHYFKIQLSGSYADKRQKDLSVLQPVLEYTAEHYTEAISIKKAAAIAGLQLNYFCRYFKKYTGYTYLEYHYMLRMSYIIKDLICTTDTIEAILERHGFTNQKLFRRMFWERFQILPGEFRKMLQNK